MAANSIKYEIVMVTWTDKAAIGIFSILVLLIYVYYITMSWKISYLY